MTEGISRSKDGVPQWTGEASTFQEYEEQALQWEQSVAYHKRALCAPRLIAELSGTARKFIAGKRPNWVSFDGGVAYLMSFLRKSLGKPQIPELSDHLIKYFRQSRRKKGESMNDYIVRKIEIYARAKQALARIHPHYSNTGSWGYGNTGWWQGSTYAPSRWTDDQWHETREAQQEEEPQENEGCEESTSQPEGSLRSSDRWGSWTSWNWHWHQEEEPWMTDAVELLPDYLQGWYLLFDANLDVPEKNMVQTALHGDFSLDKVAEILRNQWPEEELKRYDQAHRQTAYWQEDLDDEGSTDRGLENLTMAALREEGMNEEGITLMAQATEDAEEAMAVLQKAKVTLREARAKQHQVKMSRKYYQVSSGSRQAQTGVPAGLKCFRCGGNHKVAQCPDRHAPKKEDQANVTHEAAPFVCYTEEEAIAWAATQGHEKMTTEEAIEKGFGVVDGGATKTLGSVHALEAIAEENLRKHQSSRVLEVDTKDTPVFGFGNSSRDKCISTAKMKIEAGDREGVLRVHALDKGKGPVLLSIATLRALKAIVDFDEDLIVFRELDDKKLIQAERSLAGHQLLPLTDNLYSKSYTSATAIPSLRSFCSRSC